MKFGVFIEKKCAIEIIGKVRVFVVTKRIGN
jgi:hypothetical protein